MGALLSDCVKEYVALWILAIIYFVTSLVIAIWRGEKMRKLGKT
jgi:hypothetical protein